MSLRLVNGPYRGAAQGSLRSPQGRSFGAGPPCSELLGIDFVPRHCSKITFL